MTSGSENRPHGGAQQVPPTGRAPAPVPSLKRLMVRLVLVAHLPGYVALAAVLGLHYHDEQLRSREELLSHSRALAFAISQRTQEVERHLRELARHLPPDPALLPEFGRQADAAREFAAVDDIRLTGPAGEILADTSRSPAGATARLTLNAPAPAPGGPLYGRFEEPGATPDLAIAVPVDAGPWRGAALVARLDASRFDPLLAGLGLPQHWLSAVIDDRGVIVARRPQRAQLVGRTVTEPLRSSMDRDGSGVLEVTTGDGVPVVTAFLRSPEHHWTAVVSLPRAELYARVWRSAGYQVLLALTLLSAMLWFSLRLAGRLLSSVDRLRAQAEALPRDARPPAGTLAFAEASLVSDRLHASGEAMRDTQARLQASEARLRTVLRTARDAIVLCDGGDRVVLANEAAQRIFRASEPALAGRSLQQLLEPDTWTEYLAQRDKPVAAGAREEEVPVRGQGRRVDGTVFPIEYSLGRAAGAGGAVFSTIVARDITGRLQQEASLLATRTELRRMHQDFQLALMREAASRQQAIARELHDSIGSSLAGVNLLLGTAREFTHEPEAAVLISRSQEQLMRATRQVREISHGMMPAGSERGPLLVALEQFAAELNAIPGLSCTVSSRGDFENVPSQVAGHLFRVVQEAATNALRHGGAGQIRITLARTDARCRLTVLDDGSGFEPAAVVPLKVGIGLQSMRARAAAIGGSFHLSRRPGGGMRVRVAWTATDDPQLGARAL